MPVTRWLPWARASLAFAFLGHLAGDVAFDAREFAEAGVRYRWAASEPVLVQALLVIVAIAFLGPLARRALAARRPHRRTLVAAFVGTQLAVSLVLEITERLAQDEPFVRGLFASLFVPELVLAIAIAAILALLATLAARLARSIRREDPGEEIDDAVSPPRRVDAHGAIVGLALDVRGPPRPSV